MDVSVADDVISVLRRITGCWQRLGFVSFSELLEVKQKQGKNLCCPQKAAASEIENSASINSAAITQKLSQISPLLNNSK